MATLQERTVPALYARAERAFAHWEKTKDLVDEMIDLALNYRQSGHPGGSRSKVHMLLSLMLSGAMRWDVLQPWRPFADRFVLSAGHTVPLVYATLAVLNEAMRTRRASDGDQAFAFPFDGRFALTWEDLLLLRRNQGLPGHAEFAGKTLFLKANTGPSGHGMPPSVVTQYNALVDQYNAIVAQNRSTVDTYNALAAQSRSQAAQINSLPCDAS